MALTVFQSLTTAEANALPDKTSDLIYYDTVINTFMKWNGFAFVPPFPSYNIKSTIQKFTEGSGEYILPQDPKPFYIRIIVIGPGGGSSGSTSGENGSKTTFGGDLLVAAGGFGATQDGNAEGGNAKIADIEQGPQGVAIAGYSNDGEYDKSSALKKEENYGKGGSGSGQPGGLGGFITAIINAPQDSYSYEIGPSGKGGEGGEDGSPGVIEITEYYS